MIYFVQDLCNEVLGAIREFPDLKDAANDIKRIENTINYGTDEEAKQLDREMVKKYSMINFMLQVASEFPVKTPQKPVEMINGSPYKTYLRQDLCGIMCDVAIRMGIKKTIRECIDHVD